MRDAKEVIGTLLDDHAPAYVLECFYRAAVEGGEHAEVCAVLGEAATRLRKVYDALQRAGVVKS